MELVFLRVASQGLSQPSLKTFAPVFPSPTDFLWVSEDITGIASIGKKAVFLLWAAQYLKHFIHRFTVISGHSAKCLKCFLQIFDNSNRFFYDAVSIKESHDAIFTLLFFLKDFQFSSWSCTTPTSNISILDWFCIM